LPTRSSTLQASTTSLQTHHSVNLFLNYAITFKIKHQQHTTNYTNSTEKQEEETKCLVADVSASLHGVTDGSATPSPNPA
jgi:hypothetical protein